MRMSEIPLEGYEFSGCAIRRWSVISFFGTKWEDKDALETRDTAVFYYYPDETPDEQWAFAEIGTSTGIHGSAAFLPKEQWVFVMDDGEVYVAGGGGSGFERRISGQKGAYFRNVKGVAGGYAYAVGTERKVYRREAENKWTKLNSGLPATASDDDVGFDDLDGFSDSEIYACGGKGDILEQLVWYQDRIYVSTTDELFEIVNGVFRPCHLNVPKQESYARLASGDGILVVAGADQACMYDGSQWKTIL